MAATELDAVLKSDDEIPVEPDSNLACMCHHAGSGTLRFGTSFFCESALMTTDPQGTILLITRAGMGHADPDLQARLLQKYLTLLLEEETLPWAICFYTDGVKLAAEGSPVLQELRAIQERGTYLILCQTCLQAFGLLDKIQVGIVGGMGDILAAQLRAAKVISL